MADLNDAARGFEDGLVLSESGYDVRVITGGERLAEAYRLRHRVFCEELGWVDASGCGMEVDEYDEGSVSFGVYEGGALLAYARLAPPGGWFMLDDAFASLVAPGCRIRKGPEAVEVSRLCVLPEARGGQTGRGSGESGLCLLLFKGIYHWCRGRGVRYVYAVAEEKAKRLYRTRGFPFRPIWERVQMPDGMLAGAFALDWREFEELNLKSRPRFLEWFQSRSMSPSSAATAAA